MNLWGNGILFFIIEKKYGFFLLFKKISYIYIPNQTKPDQF